MKNDKTGSDRDCQSVFAALSAYLDQHLLPGKSQDDCEELERHIQDCEPCVAFVESLKKSIEIGCGYQSTVAPPALTSETRERLREAYSRALQKSGKKGDY